LTVKRSGLFLVGLLIALVALVAAGCGGGGGGGAPEALPSSSCTGIEYEGDGDPQYILASDFPLQGSSRTQTEQIVASIRYELGQRSWKAGDYKIGFQSCDDATAQAGKWDSGKCSSNANAYAANDKVLGVIGTFNSGCAAIEIPVLNQAPDGGIAMVSPANTGRWNSNLISRAIKFMSPPIFVGTVAVSKPCTISRPCSSGVT